MCPVNPNEARVEHFVASECHDLCVKREQFLSSMPEFISEAYDECDFLASEDYVSAGFFESCFCVAFIVLQDFASFSKPSLVHDLIVCLPDT